MERREYIRENNIFTMRFPLERNYEFSTIPTGGTVDQRYYTITRSTNNRWPSIRSQSFVSNRLTSRELRAPWVYVYVPGSLVFEGPLHPLHYANESEYVSIHVPPRFRESIFKGKLFIWKTFI